MPKGSGKPIPKVVFNNNPSKEEVAQLQETLKQRFEENESRHKGVTWADVEKRLSPNVLKVLSAMESSGGEPDVIGYDKTEDVYLFVDCSEQSPTRRSICYDREGEEKRKKKGINPGGNAVDLAMEMGVELLDESQYRMLQEVGDFDTKSSSWIKTPNNIRKLGGAIFGDKRYETTFVFHNGAESFYSDRGFRGMLKV